MTNSPSTRPPTITRRQMVVAGAAASTGLPIAMTLAQQSPSPVATPDASPAASPASTPVPPTPTPDPVPAHNLNIVQGRATYPEPTIGGALRMYIQSAGLEDANPAAQTQDMTLLMSVFEGLVRINPVTMTAEPGLAASWQWSDDSLSLTFALRDDAVWHDGTPFTAADAALTCMIYRDDYDSGLVGLFGLLDGAEAIDATTLLLSFAAPDGAFVYNAASMPMLQAGMYQPLWDEFVAGEKTISRPDASIASWVGTGPWRVSAVESDRVELARFDDYRETTAFADTLTLLAEDDLADRLDGWRRGDVDVLPISASQLASVWNEQGNLFVAISASAMFAAFNFHNPANATSTMMVDQSLRAALTMAVDRERYGNDVFFGFIDEYAAGTMAQPWLHDSGVRSPKRDVEAARAVLAAGGWYDVDGDGLLEDGYGNKTDLFLIVRMNERPELLALLNGLQADWAEIGVRLSIQPLFDDVFDIRWTQGREYDLIAYSLINYPAFNEFDLYGSLWDIRSNARGWNPGGYYNSGVDAAIQEWFGATDADAMQAAASAIQFGVNEDLFGIWFGFPHDLVLVREDVQGFNADIFHFSQNSHRWWRGKGAPIVATPIPAATPVASPVASPAATPRN